MKKSIKHLFITLLLVTVLLFGACNGSNSDSSSNSQIQSSSVSSQSVTSSSSSSSSSVESSTIQSSSSESSSSSSSVESSTSQVSSSDIIETYYTVTTDGYIQKVKKGDKAIEPIVTPKEDKDFVGWFEGDNEFTFDTVIERDYTIVSRWEDKNVVLPTAQGVTNLSGEMLADGETLVTAEDYTIGVLDNKSLINGQFTVAFSGTGNHGVYFRLGETEIYRGKPTGNYYALNLDAYGNITLEKGINGARQVLALSIELKGDYSAQNTYTFTLQLLDTMIRVYHGTKLILTYTDTYNIPFGNKIALYSESANSKFVVGEINADTAYECQNNTLIWSDSQIATGYKLVAGTQSKILSATTSSYNLTAFSNLPAGIYKVQLIRVTSSGESIIGEVDYIVEGVPTDITTYSGEVAMHGQDYFTKQPYTLALLKDKQILNGVISAKVTPNTPNDCGLVFRCSYGNLTNFWEHSGASYYTVLINAGGGLLLGKINDGAQVWTTLASATISNFNATNEYLITVELDDAKIGVKLNGTKVIDYTDTNYFTGTGIGFRSAQAGVKVSPITMENAATKYYVADFTSVNAQTGLPTGWVRSCEGPVADYASVSTTTEGIKVHSTNYWCNVMHYTGADFTATDYTVEMSVKVISAIDTGRWFGITVRGTQASGYYRTWLTMLGGTGGSTQSNFTLSDTVKVSNANTSNGTNASAITYGDTVSVRVTVSGMNLYYFVNGAFVHSVTLPSGYASGTFGFTFGGGEYLIKGITVRSVLTSDLVTA